MEDNNTKKLMDEQDGTATHSGWHLFYGLFSKYRDECLKIGQIVFGTNQNTSIKFLRQYVSSLYSMAQQIFSFYPVETEKEITDEWLSLNEETEDAIYLYGDDEFRSQILSEGKSFITKELKLKLIMFYNKIDRLASKAGLLVNKEKKDLNEPKKGLLGM